MHRRIVAGGVLLALWAQALFERRKEARIHGDTIAHMDAVFGRVLTQTAARVSSSECARAPASWRAWRRSAGSGAAPTTLLPIAARPGAPCVCSATA